MMVVDRRELRLGTYDSREAGESNFLDVELLHKGKNYLFAGSNAGGERAVAIYTIVQTAKLNDRNPEAYLHNILGRTADGHPINRISETVNLAAISMDIGTQQDWPQHAEHQTLTVDVRSRAVPRHRRLRLKVEAEERWRSIMHVGQVRNVLSSLGGINRSHVQPTRRCNERNVVRLSRTEIDVKVLTPIIVPVGRSVAPRAENPMCARRQVDEENPFRDGASRSIVDLDILAKGDVCALGTIEEHAALV
jgi:hypothetical protein